MNADYFFISLSYRDQVGMVYYHFDCDIVWAVIGGGAVMSGDEASRYRSVDPELNLE